MVCGGHSPPEQKWKTTLSSLLPGARVAPSLCYSYSFGKSTMKREQMKYFALLHHSCILWTSTSYGFLPGRPSHITTFHILKLLRSTVSLLSHIALSILLLLPDVPLENDFPPVPSLDAGLSRFTSLNFSRPSPLSQQSSPQRWARWRRHLEPPRTRRRSQTRCSLS